MLVQNEAVLCWRNGKNAFSASVIWYKARSLAVLTGIRKGFRSGSRVNVLLLELEAEVREGMKGEKRGKG